MMVVLTYDVSLTADGGAKRLRRVAKLCERYGMRVQNSVFELLVDAGQLISIKAKLADIINPEEDSVRIYRLGKVYESKIEYMGKPLLVHQGNTMIL